MNNLEEPTTPSKKSSSGEEKVSFTIHCYMFSGKLLGTAK
jgi:hypothetical protein